MMKQKKRLFWGIFGVLLAYSAVVIWYTWYLACFGHWTEQNLSVVGYWLGHENGLRLWGWFTGTFFVGFMIYLIRLFRYRGRLAWIFTGLAGMFLIVGVYIPFDPDWSEFWSNVHIGISFCSPVTLVGAIVTFELWLKNKCHYPMTFPLVLTGILTLIAAALLIHYTIVTSVLELYVVCVCAAFLNGMALLGLLTKRDLLATR